MYIIMFIHGFTPLTHEGGPTYNKLCANFLHVGGGGVGV